MSGSEMLAKTERRDDIRAFWCGVKVGIIILCLLSIAGHVRELWQAFGA